MLHLPSEKQLISLKLLQLNFANNDCGAFKRLILTTSACGGSISGFGLVGYCFKGESKYKTPPFAAIIKPLSKVLKPCGEAQDITCRTGVTVGEASCSKKEMGSAK